MLQTEVFHILFLPVTVLDLLDVAAVSFVFYRAYRVIQGTTAARMLMGLILILVLSVLVRALHMDGMIWLVDQIQTVWVIAFVIIFQPELRRLLFHFGQSGFLRNIIKLGIPEYAEDVIKACEWLSKKRYGAIVVLERSTGLRNIIETGVLLHAKVSQQLIISIFNPRSPLHDGAIVIENDLVEAARCLLPLSQNPYIETSLGTRHRAAVGLSEQTDAIAVVVSEETGRISVAHRGILHSNLTGQQLRDLIESVMSVGKARHILRTRKDRS